jgi:uncharacterized protein (DUF433 family)
VETLTLTWRGRYGPGWAGIIRQATGWSRGRLTVVSRLERITVDPSICHGKPTIRGLRYPVESLLELLASGMTIEEIIDDHPNLERDDLLAALELGALVSAQRRVPLGTG